MSQQKITYLDYSGETSTTEWDVTQMTAGNLVTVQGDLADLVIAIDGISLATIARERRILENLFLANNKPTSVDAQREKKWLVRYEDTVTHNIYRTEIPGADLTLLQTNSDMADLTTAAFGAFIAAFETVVKAPGTQNAVNVLDVEFVGKRI